MASAGDYGALAIGCDIHTLSNSSVNFQNNQLITGQKIQLGMIVTALVFEFALLGVLLFFNKSVQFRVALKDPKFASNLPVYRLDTRNPLFVLQVFAIVVAIASGFLGVAGNHWIQVNNLAQCTAVKKLSVSLYVVFNAVMYAFFWVKIKISNMKFGARPAEKLITCFAMAIVPVFLIWTLVNVRGIWLTSPSSTCVCLTQIVQVGSTLFCVFDLLVNLTFLFMFISALAESLRKQGILRASADILSVHVSDNSLNSSTDEKEGSGNHKTLQRQLTGKDDSKDEVSRGEPDAHDITFKSDTRDAAALQIQQMKVEEMRAKTVLVVRKTMLATFVSIMFSSITITLLTAETAIRNLDFGVSIFAFASTINMLVSLSMMHFSTFSAWSFTEEKPAAATTAEALTGSKKKSNNALSSLCPWFSSTSDSSKQAMEEQLLDKRTVSRFDLKMLSQSQLLQK
eukprot:TRINITY_DN9750_c0_g1_i1.p1 TRINITY_DN9750_c0_g1~~TRINITY_DN9750_c0_g1_i1.p1  ORF type:complete len:468 (+),score=126.83 TRINITY_DN9750_c0_g1_i1:38-1405(+)